MTPRELKAAHDGLYGRADAPLSRGELEGLMLQFPDA